MCPYPYIEVPTPEWVDQGDGVKVVPRGGDCEVIVVVEYGLFTSRNDVGRPGVTSPHRRSR